MPLPDQRLEEGTGTANEIEVGDELRGEPMQFAPGAIVLRHSAFDQTRATWRRRWTELGGRPARSARSPSEKPRRSARNQFEKIGQPIGGAAWSV